MPEPIIIKQSDLPNVMFQDVAFDILKRSTINGEKVEITYKVNWNGALGEVAMKQASRHQAKNWYNNHRPSEDIDIMSASECERRKQLFLDLNGKINEIDAVAEVERAKKHTAKEIIENLSRKDLPEDQRQYWLAQHGKMRAERDMLDAAVKEAERLLKSTK